LFLVGRGETLLALDGVERADGRDDVAGLGFFAAGNGRRRVLKVAGVMVGRF
jgi:hypothetical protein